MASPHAVFDDEHGEAYELRPTLTDVRRWCAILNGEFGELEASQAYESAIYYQDFDVESREGTIPVKSGSAPADCDAAIDTLTPQDLLVRVRPARNRKKYADQAEKLGRFGKAMVFAWRRRKDVIRAIVSDMCLRRVGVGRVLVDDTLWPKMPEWANEDPSQDEGEDEAAFAERVEDWDDKRTRWEARHRRKCPILLERRDPRSVRWREDPSTGELLIVVEKYQTTVLEARQAFGHFPLAEAHINKKDMNDSIWVQDVWIGRYRCLLLDDEPVFPGGQGQYKGVMKHPYSEIPYIIAPFRELPADRPVDRYRGMLTNAADLYPSESEVLTMHLEILRWMAWRTYIGHTLDGRDIPVVPGLMIDIDEQKHEYLKVLEGTAVPPEVMNTATQWGNYINRNSVSQGPTGADGTRSAQQLLALNAQREKKLTAPQQALQRFLERALSLAAMELEENLDGTLILPIPGKDRLGNDLGEVQIKPDDVDGYWDGFEVAFSRRLDPAILEVNKALQSFAQNNYISLKTAHTLGGLVDDPQEEEDNILDQSTERQPWFTELLALKRAELYYGEDSWEYQIVFQKFMQSQNQGPKPPGGPGGGGPPGGLTGKPMHPPGQRGGGMGGGDAMAGLGGGIAAAQQMGHGRPAGKSRSRPPKPPM